MQDFQRRPRKFYTNNKNISKSATTIDWLKNSMKSFIFQIFYVILSDSNRSTFSVVIIFLIHFLQQLSLSSPIQNSAQNVWEYNTGYSILEQFIHSVKIIHLITNFNNIAVYVTFLYLAIGFTIFLYAIAILVYNLSQNATGFMFSWSAVLLRKLCIAMTILYIPVLEILFSTINCVSYTNAYVEDFTCWKGVNIVHQIIAIIFGILFILAGFIITLMNNDTNLLPSKRIFLMYFYKLQFKKEKI